VTGSPAVCGSSNVQVAGTTEAAYSAHHEPFQYFASTANPHHLPPSSPSMIGYTDQANHQYDLSSFWLAADSGNLPAVSFLKADRYQDGHPANSDPLDEQDWLVNTINALENLPTWSSTAIIINWDDSDGWYDQVMGPIVNPSSDPANDVLNGNSCGTGTSPLGVEDRCGYGPRIPILVISPYAKHNFVDNTLTDQTSILKFIEDNWHLGSVGPTSFDNLAGSLDGMFNFNQPPSQAKLFLNPQTGEPIQSLGGSGNYGPLSSLTGLSSSLSSIGALSSITGLAALSGLPSSLSSISGLGTSSQGGLDPNPFSTCTDQDTNPDVCAIQSTFNGTPVSAGNYIWFNSEMSLRSTVPSTGLTVHYSGQWIFAQLKDGTTLQLPAPNAEVIYSPTATTPTTTFTGGQWVTTVPTSFTGNVFLSGLAYQIPAGVSLQGAKVTWTGAFSGTTNSFKLQWQWGAAAYSGFGTLNLSNTNALYNGLGVNPTGMNMGNTLLNSNPAGTPENFKANVIGGATGNGGSNWTGYQTPTGTASYQAYLLNE
jgi:hypothetical protein